MNLFGFSRAEMGIGQSCRYAAAALEAAGVPFGILHYPETAHRMSDLSWRHKETDEAVYNVNVYHLNAPDMQAARRYFGEERFSGADRYKIAYWHWELPEFPDEYAAQVELVDEVWVPTKFVHDSVAKKVTVPVVIVPHGIEAHASPAFSRASFGLPENRFLFCSMCDTMSFMERKNPYAVIESFKLAFDKDDPNVGLVLKLNSLKHSPLEVKKLVRQIGNWKNIYLLGGTMSKGAVNALLQCTDCFVSLHRAEGFGFGMAEAMYMGKPVIATNWSGNTDFMTPTNSCLVNCTLVPIGRDYGPYRADQKWAEPDVNHAATFMQAVFNDDVYRNTIAREGQATIRRHYSLKAAGERMKQRLTELGLL